MTEDFRRIVKSRADAGQRQDKDSLLSRFDLDTTLLVLTPQGKLTLDLAVLSRALGIDKMPRTTVEVEEITTFEGAGTTGLVPDPGSEAARYLKDNGVWDTPAGAGDMTRAVYDIDLDNIVDKAEELNDGANVVTAAQARTHLDDTTTNPHAIVGSNVGASGVGPYEGVSGKTLRFKNLTGANGLTVTDDVANDEIDLGISDGGVNVVKLLGTGTPSMLVNDGVGPTVSWRTVPNQGIIVRKASATDLGTVTLSAQNMWVGRGVSGDLAAANHNPGMMRSLLQSLACAGTAFPAGLTAVDDGWWFYRTDHDMFYTYCHAYAGWLSVAEYVLQGGHSGTLAATNYVDLVYGLAQPFDASNIGLTLPFPVKPVWIAANVQGSSTVTFFVRDEGANVTNATLAYAAAAGKLSTIFVNTATVTGTIAKDRNISIAVTAGSAVDGHTIHVGFRRFES